MSTPAFVECRKVSSHVFVVLTYTVYRDVQRQNAQLLAKLTKSSTAQDMENNANDRQKGSFLSKYDGITSYYTFTQFHRSWNSAA